MLPSLQIKQDHVRPASRADWPGLAVEVLPTTSMRAYDFIFDGPAHYICVGLSGRRKDSVVEVDGHHPTPFLDIADRIHVVPAGATFRGFSVPATSQRFVQIFLDPRRGALHPEIDLAGLAPRLASLNPAIVATARKLAAAVEDEDPLGRLYGEALGCCLAIELLQWQQGGSEPDKAPASARLSRQQLHRVTAYMMDHLAEDIGLVELAAIVGLTPWHFCRVFHNSTGLPPHQWLIAQRIQRAKDLLYQGHLSVTEIALATGFGGSTQFARTFRRLVGTSPVAWQRQQD